MYRRNLFIFTPISNTPIRISNTALCNFKFQQQYLKLPTMKFPFSFYIVEVPRNTEEVYLLETGTV